MLVRLDTLQPWTGEVVNGLRHPGNIEQLWSEAELAAAGLAKPVPFVAPDGKRAVGPATYEKDGEAIVAVRAVEDVPPPVVLTAAEKVSAMLADYDLSLADMKAALATAVAR